MGKKKRTPTRESQVKRDLRTPKYKMRVERNRKRDQKRKGLCIEVWEDLVPEEFLND